jgi:hypothetical protein
MPIFLINHIYKQCEDKFFKFKEKYEKEKEMCHIIDVPPLIDLNMRDLITYGGTKKIDGLL